MLAHRTQPLLGRKGPVTCYRSSHSVFGFKGAIAQASRESVAGRHTLRPRKLTLRLCRIAAQPSSVHIQLRISVPGRPPREGCLACKAECAILSSYGSHEGAVSSAKWVSFVQTSTYDKGTSEKLNHKTELPCPWRLSGRGIQLFGTGSIPVRRSRIPLNAECENAHVLRLSCTLKISMGQKLIQRTLPPPPPPLHLSIHSLIWSQPSL